jgi:hypothetical protein
MDGAVAPEKAFPQAYKSFGSLYVAGVATLRANGQPHLPLALSKNIFCAQETRTQVPGL